MDPLSDVLSLLKIRSYMSGGFDVGDEWSIKFGPHDGIKFHAVISGACWLSVEGVAEPVRIKGGDCFMLARGRPFRLASDMAVPPIDAYTLLPTVRDGRIVTYNGGGDFFSVGGYFTLADGYADMLVGMLPPIVHIHQEADKAMLRWIVDRMRQELREPQPGGFIVAQQLATMVLVQVLRLHLAEGLRNGVGWLFALADKQMKAAIYAMHENPAQRWTLQAMAERAGMSRTVFTLKFKETVGMSPMEYLTRWRMRVAADKLMNSRDSLTEIALALGYESESAFSTAFKRVMGTSPRQYSRHKNAVLGSRDGQEAA